MSSHDKEQSHCDAYEKILDLDLFNALLALVVKMSDNKDAMLEYSRFISQKSLWASTVSYTHLTLPTIRLV